VTPVLVRASILLVALAVVTAGACGGGATAKDRFIDEATAVCDDSAAEIEVASNATLTPSSTEEQVAAFLKNRYVPLLRKRLEKLRDLKPPIAERSTLDGIYTDFQAVIDAIEADPVKYTNQADDPFADIEVRFDEFGLIACGSRAES
jgi:hypothetical protein